MSDAPGEDEAGPRADVPRYAEEPRFPRVLIGAWVIFGAWAVYYVVEKLVPAYHAWARGL
jgi:hypothetical protein